MRDTHVSNRQGRVKYLNTSDQGFHQCAFGSLFGASEFIPTLLHFPIELNIIICKDESLVLKISPKQCCACTKGWGVYSRIGIYPFINWENGIGSLRTGFGNGKVNWDWDC